MRFVQAWSDPKRWDWFAASEPDAARKVVLSSQPNNSVQRLLFEAGLILLITLAFAALIEIVFKA